MYIMTAMTPEAILTLEREYTFLARRLPPRQLLKRPPSLIEDFYVPTGIGLPRLRLRRIDGAACAITLKKMVGDASRHVEESWTIDPTEFDALCSQALGTVTKSRYEFVTEGSNAQLDEFHGRHEGLFLYEFEFEGEMELAGFRAPDVCLVDVTHEDWVAGGSLAFTNFSELADVLAKHNYAPPRWPSGGPGATLSC